jgi:hypothetical protein
MQTNEPGNNTTDDQSKDLNEPGSEYRNQEGENHSTASEGTLKNEETDEHKKSMGTGTKYKAGEEQDLDDLVHKQAERKGDKTATTSLDEDESIHKEHTDG